ncbi:hypothetical protein F5879DRAFT_925868 [Lentinula edodes]|nr:hypothetical protein F5879DRAFT_925868 [Lentinula edodes]
MSSSFERMVYTRSLLPMSSSHDQNLTANLHDQVLLPDHDGWYRSMNANQLRTDSSSEARPVYRENETKNNSSNEMMDVRYGVEDSDDDRDTQSLRIISSNSTTHSGPTNVFQRSEDPAVENLISHEPISPGVFELRSNSDQKLDEFVPIAYMGNAILPKDESGDDMAMDIAETQRHFNTTSTSPVLDIPVLPSSDEICNQGENRRKIEEDKLDNSTTSLPLSDAPVMLASKEACNPTENDTHHSGREEDKSGPGLILYHVLRDLILLDLDLPKILFTAGCIGYLLFLVRAFWKIRIMFRDQPLACFGHVALSVGLLVFIRYNGQQVQGRYQRSGLLPFVVDTIIFIGAFMCTSIMWWVVCVMGDIANVALSVIIRL